MHGEKKRGGAKNKTLPTFFAASLGIVILLGAWQLLAYLLKSNGNNGVPYPFDTFCLAFSFLFLDGAPSTWAAVGWTLLRILIGLVISFAFGAIFGVLAGVYPRIKDFLSQIISILRAIPTVAVVLMLISILMGMRAHAWLSWIPVALTFVVCFPLYYQAFVSGIENEDKDVRDSLSLEGAEKKWVTIKDVYVPDSWDYVKLSLIQTFGLSFKVSVMAEVLTSSSAGKIGIGTLIVMSRQATGGIEEIPAYALIVLLLMALIDLPFVLIKRRQN